MKIYQKNNLGFIKVLVLNGFYDGLYFIYAITKMIISVICVVYGIVFFGYGMVLGIYKQDPEPFNKSFIWVIDSLYNFITKHSFYMTYFKIMAVLFVYAFLYSAVKRLTAQKKA